MAADIRCGAAISELHADPEKLARGSASDRSPTIGQCRPKTSGPPASPSRLSSSNATAAVARSTAGLGPASPAQAKGWAEAQRNRLAPLTLKNPKRLGESAWLRCCKAVLVGGGEDRLGQGVRGGGEFTVAVVGQHHATCRQQRVGVDRGDLGIGEVEREPGQDSDPEAAADEALDGVAVVCAQRDEWLVAVASQERFDRERRVLPGDQRQLGKLGKCG
jgi:hypothetical protein